MLEPARKELEDLGLEVSSKKAELKRLIKDAQKAVDDREQAMRALGTTNDALTDRIEDATLTNKALTDRKEMLEGQLEILEAKVLAQTSTSAVFSDTIAKLKEEMGIAATERQQSIRDATARLAEDQQARETAHTAQAEAEKQLRTINYKLTESIQRLTETQQAEEATRTELAHRKIALDKREEALKNGENALKLRKVEVYNYARALDL